MAHHVAIYWHGVLLVFTTSLNISMTVLLNNVKRKEGKSQTCVSQSSLHI